MLIDLPAPDLFVKLPLSGKSSLAAHPWTGMAAVEILLVFAVFFLQGAWPVPDVNEPYYLGKAIHFWHPEWIADDFFLNSADTHEVFYFTVGWLALWLAPWLMAWVGRVLTWLLLAWAWWRLSWAVVARRWVAVLTAALFACALERCHMAGEWVIGGVEAKGFAFVLLFLGVEALVRNRWNRSVVLFGGAALFHVLVGGWSLVAAAIAWLLAGSQRPALVTLWPGLLFGAALSLPGLIPSLSLTWGVAPEIVARANFVYVYERLSHHLVLSAFPVFFVLRFGLLLCLWLVLCRRTPSTGATGRLQGFVTGGVAIALVGLLISALAALAPVRAAGLLRFYWFRLSDVAVPLGVALLGTWWIVEQLRLRPTFGKPLLAAATLIAGLHLGEFALLRPFPTIPRAVRVANYGGWREVCTWIAASPDVPPDARFLTPKLNQTFKWYTGRSEVANFKDIPQDAQSIVEWWDRLLDLHATGHKDPQYRWHDSLTELSLDRLRHLGEKYGAAYLVTESEPPLMLEQMYRNRTYAVYRLTPAAATPGNRSQGEKGGPGDAALLPVRRLIDPSVRNQRIRFVTRLSSSFDRFAPWQSPTNRKGGSSSVCCQTSSRAARSSGRSSQVSLSTTKTRGSSSIPRKAARRAKVSQGQGRQQVTGKSACKMWRSSMPIFQNHRPLTTR